jgi:hypothetical protein
MIRQAKERPAATPHRAARLFLVSAALLAFAALTSSRGLPNASADSTGFRNPGAQSADTGGDNNGYETNATDAFTNDGAPAEDTNSGTNTTLSCTDAGKDRHRFYDYGFSVPAGATIDGIEATVDVRLDNGPGYICLQLSWDGGASWTAPKQTANLTSSFASYSVGGPSDTWGRAWSASDFSSASFRLRVIDVAANSSGRFRLDWIGAQVYYTPAAPDTVGPATSNVAAAGAGGSLVTLTATVNDTAAGNSNISVAEYFIDSVGAGGTGTAMAAADGAFDSAVEPVTASVDMGGQPGGNHTLYVHGRDAAGNWGASGSVVVAVTTGGGSAVQATITLAAGTLSLDAYDVVFPPVSLDGLDQTVDASPVPWRALDARGTGAGWNVSVTSSDFTSTGGSIPVGNLKLQVLQSNITTLSGNEPPLTQAASYQALSSVLPLKVLSATAGTGMGSYDFTPDFRLTVPSSAVPGDYQASLIVSVNSGP